MLSGGSYSGSVLLQGSGQVGGCDHITLLGGQPPGTFPGPPPARCRWASDCLGSWRWPRSAGRAGNGQERGKKEKKCQKGTHGFSPQPSPPCSRASAGAHHPAFLPGKASPCWLWPLPRNVPPWEAPIPPQSPPSLLLLGARVPSRWAGNPGMADLCPARGAGCTPAARRRFWGESSAFCTGQSGCPDPSCVRHRPCSLPCSATPGTHSSRDCAKFS